VLIEFTKRADGRTVLRCERADGSVTWQRNDDQHAAFFPLHDLTHYAVETELGFTRGFFGLIAEGWNIEETTGKSARGALPNEALEVEYIVSAFSAERVGGGVASTAEFNQLAATFASAKGMPPPRRLTDGEMTKVRARFDELSERWRTLAPGHTLELMFPSLL
jgi:hypothetical protein